MAPFHIIPPIRLTPGQKADDPAKAIKSFESIISKEEEPGEWGFKALKQLTKLTFRSKRFEDSLKYYIQLLPYTKKAVTRK
jgi:COP9 signalosome complex subunit 2